MPHGFICSSSVVYIFNLDVAEEILRQHASAETFTGTLSYISACKLSNEGWFKLFEVGV